jgi:hypothetical protein
MTKTIIIRYIIIDEPADKTSLRAVGSPTLLIRIVSAMAITIRLELDCRLKPCRPDV